MGNRFVTTLASLRSLEILFAFAVQVAVMGEWPSMWACAGAGLVFLSVLMISLEAVIVRELPESMRRLL